MELTLDKAIDLLEKSKGKALNDLWIEHCYCVGNSAGVIAKNLGLDENYAKIIGYVHDIGKSVGEFKDHVYNGYNFLKELGYDEKFYSICLTHSYLNNDINCTAGGIPKKDKLGYDFIKEYVENHEYSIYEKIVNLCDLMCTNKVLTIDKRLIDIMIRKGVDSNTQYHIEETFKLKKYFDDMLGCNLYSLFPEIKENL